MSSTSQKAVAGVRTSWPTDDDPWGDDSAWPNSGYDTVDDTKVQGLGTSILSVILWVILAMMVALMLVLVPWTIELMAMVSYPEGSEWRGVLIFGLVIVSAVIGIARLTMEISRSGQWLRGKIGRRLACATLSLAPLLVLQMWLLVIASIF